MIATNQPYIPLEHQGEPVCNEVTPEVLWETAVGWVDGQFNSICRSVRRFRPVPYVVDTGDLRQESYVVAFESLEKSVKKKRIDLFTNIFFKELEWKIKKNYPSILINDNVCVDDLPARIIFDFIPSSFHPMSISKKIQIKALALMSSSQIDTWNFHLSTSSITDEYRGLSRRGYFNNLSRGIEAVYRNKRKGGYE